MCITLQQNDIAIVLKNVHELDVLHVCYCIFVFSLDPPDGTVGDSASGNALDGEREITTGVRKRCVLHYNKMTLL